jgi:multiple sugar transport system substrate-binding protein
MRKKGWLILIISCLVLLGGCKPTESTPKTLTIVLSGLQQPNEKTFFRTFVRLFEAEHGIKVDVIYELPDQLFTTIDQQYKNNAVTTDVIMVDSARMSQYLTSNYLVDLDWLDLETDRTFTTMFDAYTHLGGYRYFAPISLDVYLTLYNKEALPYMPPTVDVTKNDADEIIRVNRISWQDLAIWAKTIKTVTGTARFGFPYGNVSSQLIYPITGMGLAMGEHTMPAFSDEGAERVWAYLFDLKQAGALAFGPSFAGLTQPTELLNANQLWMSFGHMGPLGSSYNANPNKYVLGPIPIDETSEHGGTTAGAWGYGIIRNSKNQAAARAWVKFITDPEINYLYCSGLGGVISPIKEVINHLGSSNTDQIMRMGVLMLDQTIHVKAVDTSGYSSWNDVKLLYIDLYQQLINGDFMDESLLNQYQTSLNQLKINP